MHFLALPGMWFLLQLLRFSLRREMPSQQLLIEAIFVALSFRRLICM